MLEKLESFSKSPSSNTVHVSDTFVKKRKTFNDGYKHQYFSFIPSSPNVESPSNILNSNFARKTMLVSKANKKEEEELLMA